MKVLNPSSIQCVAPLVRADDHREPAVSDLVRGKPVEFLSRILHAVEQDPEDTPYPRRGRQRSPSPATDMGTNGGTILDSGLHVFR